MKKLTLSSTIVLLLFAFGACSGEGRRTDRTTAAQSGDSLYIYKCIEYARAERFMPPVVSDNAGEDNATCDPTSEAADEEHLCLSLMAPRASDAQSRPVVVWLHNDEPATEADAEQHIRDASELARRTDKVVVCVRPRHGVMGYLDLSAFGERYVHSGNAGLLDLIAALRWLSSHVTRYGGNPNDISLFARTDAAHLAESLLASPPATGLFRAAMIEQRTDERIPEAKLTRRLGIAVLEELDLTGVRIEELRTLSRDRLHRAGAAALSRIREENGANGMPSPVLGWGPNVDGDILPCQPSEAKVRGISQGVHIQYDISFNQLLNEAI